MTSRGRPSSSLPSRCRRCSSSSRRTSVASSSSSSSSPSRPSPWPGRVLLRYAFEAIRRRGHDARFMLVAGTGRLAQDFADRVESHPGLGMQIIGHLSAPGETDHIVTRPILGSVEDVEEILHSQVVDEVAVCLPPSGRALHGADHRSGRRRGQDGADSGRSGGGVHAECPPRRVRRLRRPLARPRRATRGRARRQAHPRHRRRHLRPRGDQSGPAGRPQS